MRLAAFLISSVLARVLTVQMMQKCDVFVLRKRIECCLPVDGMNNNNNKNNVNISLNNNHTDIVISNICVVHAVLSTVLPSFSKTMSPRYAHSSLKTGKEPAEDVELR